MTEKQIEMMAGLIGTGLLFLFGLFLYIIFDVALSGKLNKYVLRPQGDR